MHITKFFLSYPLLFFYENVYASNPMQCEERKNSTLSLTDSECETVFLNDESHSEYPDFDFITFSTEKLTQFNDFSYYGSNKSKVFDFEKAQILRFSFPKSIKSLDSFLDDGHSADHFALRDTEKFENDVNFTVLKHSNILFYYVNNQLYKSVPKFNPVNATIKVGKPYCWKKQEHGPIEINKPKFEFNITRSTNNFVKLYILCSNCCISVYVNYGNFSAKSCCQDESNFNNSKTWFSCIIGSNILKKEKNIIELIKNTFDYDSWWIDIKKCKHAKVATDSKSRIKEISACVALSMTILLLYCF